MNVNKYIAGLAAIFLVFFNTNNANAADYPAGQFSATTNKMWKIVQENEDASVLFKDNSKNKETIVLRVFDQTSNSKDRAEAFKNNLPQITQARNRLLELSGGGRQDILEATPFSKIGSKKIEGFFIESVFENANKEKSQIFERQYFAGNKIFQVLYVTRGTGVKVDYAKSVLDSFLPKSNRIPASELARSETVRPGQSDSSAYKDVDLSIPALNISKSVSKSECTSLPVEKRRLESSTTGEISATVLASAGGCMVGVWESIKSTLIGLKDVVVGLYNYAADSVYREQINAALGILWAEFSNDPKQFSQRIVTNVYNLAAQSGSDFMCMNAVAQAETVCKLLPYVISGGFLVKIATRAKLTVAEAKAIQEAAATAKKSVLAETTTIAKAVDVVEINGPPKGMIFDERGVFKGGNGAFESKLGDMNLITHAQLDKLPKGTVLYSFNGEKVVVGVDRIDGDTRGGFLAYGFLKKDISAGNAGAAGSAGAVPRLSSSSKPITWAEGDKVISRATSELKSSNPETVRAALGDIKNTKFDYDSFKGVSPAAYNEKMMGVVDNLTDFVRSPSTSPELKKEAAEALLQYSRVNSGNYKLGYLGRRAPETFGEIYYDPRVPEGIRKMVHLEMSVAYRSAGSGSFPNFRSSASMMDEFTRTGRVQGTRW